MDAVQSNLLALRRANHIKRPWP